MKPKPRLRKLSLSLLISAGMIALATPLVVSAQYERPEGAVFSLSNEISGNRVVAFDRMADGSLNPARSFATGGTGSGGGLGNQGALAISDSGHWLLAVNPGSDSVSVFFVLGNYLLRTDTRPSGGVRPVSVAIENDVVYVLNAGSDSLQGFKLGIYGRLTPIAGSNTPLSGSGTGAAQVGFNRDGDLLAVTEKATNLVLSFPVDGDGALGKVNVQASPAPTPFGFSFGRSDQMLVSEAAGGAAGASTLSSYRLRANGAASVVTAASPSGQSAACWVVTTRSGRYAYVSNTASDNLSTYVVAGNGAVSLLGGNQISASTGAGSGPTDMALDRNSRYLYVLNPKNSTLSALRVAADGSLKTVETQASGLPGSATGLVAR